MIKMKEFEIGKNEAGQRFDKYLHKRLPGASKNFLYKMLRKKNIVLNDKKAAGSERLIMGDHVKIFFSDETFEKLKGSREALLLQAAPMEQPLPVIYEDSDILVINKPAGMLSQKAQPADLSANEWILRYLLDTGAVTEQELETFRPSVCNRLDRNTSGLLIAGKTLKGLQEMSDRLKAHATKKYYHCIVSGIVDRPRHLSGHLYKDHVTNQVTVSEKERPGSRYIETAFRPIRQYADTSYLEVHLITGRTHQIRAHLAAIGHPVVGDAKYGDARVNAAFRKQTGLDRQLLHACRILFPDGKEVDAPLPEDFTRVLQWLDKNHA